MSRANDRPLLLACALGLLGPACAGEGEVTFPGAGAGGAAGDSTVGGGATGTGGGGATGGGGSAPQSTALFGVPNVDDDDGDGAADWHQALTPQDNEPSVLVLPAELVAALSPNDTVELTLSGETDAVVFWRDGQIVLGWDGPNGVISTLTLAGSEAASASFLVDFSTFHREVGLHLRQLDEASVEVASWDVALWGAPLVLAHHRQPAERVWVVEAPSNQSMIQVLQQQLGARLQVLPSSAGGGWDVWVQDQLEWATATAPGKRLDVAMNSTRNRPLRAWVESLKAPDVQPMTWGQVGTDTTEDKFGNLETTPPLSAGGIDYPFGRIYYGDNGAGIGPNATLKGFLAEQQLQAPVAVDTSWLCVGHADEFMTFVPDPSAPKGFKLLYSDVNVAYALLDSLDPATALPRYASAHGYSTIGQMVGDAALRALNQDVQTDYLDPIRAELMTTLGLGEADLVRVPSLWERIASCPYSGAYLEVAALIPGMINLTVVDVEGEPRRLFIADPFLRPGGASQASDPMVQAFSALMPAGTELYFVDDWYDYHLGMGEVHCATNVQRTPTAPWWTDGLHLLGGL
jgi:hypothetical protein